MLIAADEQIPGVREVFGDLGEVRPFAGRTVTASDVSDADALVVRSVTRVDERLLSASKVRFVGTATSGTDHVDTAYLASQGIAFASAAGSNARPVAEYVLTAILLLAHRHRFDPREKTLGVVGVGQVGSIVADWAQRLGMTVLRCDPPLAEARDVRPPRREPKEPRGRDPGEPRALPARRDAAVPADGRPECADGPPNPTDWITPAGLLAASDIVTLHVPLTSSGPHKTAGMVDAAWLAAMRPGAFLINTSRGGVVSEPALHDALAAGRLGGAVCDVWLNEPHVDASLVARCEIATPHIAGHTLEAKRRAVAMIREAFDASLRRRGSLASGPTEVAGDRQAGRAMAQMCNKDGGYPALRDMLDAMSEACGLLKSDMRLRGAADRDAVAAEFDAIRAQCGARREFASHAIDLAGLDPEAASFLREIGLSQKEL